MDCSKFPDEKLLDAYGELEHEPEGYRDHIESCPGCRTDLDDLRELSESYRFASRERLPRAPKLPRRSDRWIPAVAAAILLAAIVGILFRPTMTPAPVAPLATGAAPVPHKFDRPLPAWDADDQAFDDEFRDLRMRLERLESEVKRRPS